jgi:Tol biopolymer transport system component
MLLAAAAGWGWLHRETPAATGAYQLDVLPPDGETVYQDAGGGYQAISPDGRTLAYITESNGGRHILVRPLDSPTSRTLAGTELADGLFWSPDSRHLGFTAGSKLERVDLANGTVKEICEGVGSSLRGASWSADGTILFASTSTPLQKVPAEGGSPVPVLEYAKGEATQNFPQFLPDGKHFLFYVVGGQAGLNGVYAGSIDRPPNQERRQILAGSTAASYAASRGSKDGYLLVLRERTVLAQPFDAERLTLSGTARSVAEDVGSRTVVGQFVPSRNGILSTGTTGTLFHTVTVVSRDGKSIASVGGPGTFRTIRLAPDGKSAAVVESLSNGGAEIAILDMTHGRPVAFTSEGGISVFPVWSPDGKEILFSSHRGETYRLYRKPILGKEQEIPTGPNRAYASAWIHHPERVVYAERTPSSMTLMVLPLASGSTPTPLFEGSRGLTYSSSISRSQRWVAAYTSEESGRPEVYVRSMPRNLSACSISERRVPLPARHSGSRSGMANGSSSFVQHRWRREITGSPCWATGRRDFGEGPIACVAQQSSWKSSLSTRATFRPGILPRVVSLPSARGAQVETPLAQVRPGHSGNCRAPRVSGDGQLHQPGIPGRGGHSQFTHDFT